VHWLATYTDSFIRLFYPLLCKGCGNEVFKQDNILCWRCLEELPFTKFEQYAENPVKHIFTGRLRLQEASSLIYFNKDSITQAIVHRIKYQGEKELGVYMGEMMGNLLAQQARYQQIDSIIPLPLNERKLRQRGFNQSALLATGIANKLGKPVQTSAVMRTHYTATQTKKNRIQRWVNVEHVFDISNQHQLENKHVLLVDDVITTGATMEAMGSVLLKIPGLKLSLCSLAYASRI
jgi:ComF family protein